MKPFYRKCLGLVVSFGATACASRAPTTNELDTRSGLYGPRGADFSFERALDRATLQNAGSKDAAGPVRLAPSVARVWVYDQTLEGGHWLQGTWVYVEVEPSRWLREPAAAGQALTLTVPSVLPTRFIPDPAPAAKAPTVSLPDRKGGDK